MSEDEDWADDTPLESFKKSVELRLSRKKANESIKSWPDEKELKKLDTNIRKNSAFVKAKLETLRENQRKALETEFNKLNLVRYKQEAITTLTTTKYKQVDIELAVFICELFHHRFTDFQDMVCEAWKGIFGKYRELFNNHKRSEKKKPDNKDTIPPDLDLSKIRLDIKFISELTCLSILPGKSGLGLLHYILGQFMVENEGKQKEFLPLVLTILKNIGDSIFGLVAKSKTDEICHSALIPVEKQTIFSDMLKKYYEWLVGLLKDKHKELQRQEKRNLRMLTEVKGEISDKRKEQTRSLHEDYQFWLEKLNTLADYLSVELPDFDAVEKAEESKVGIEIVIEKVKAAGDLGVWEDEDQKAFYTSIRGLKDTIPGILWQQSSNIHRDPEKARKSRKKKQGSGRADTNKPKMGKDLDGDMFGYMDDFYEFDSDDDLDLETGADLDDGSGDTLTFNSWMTKLSECYNRDLVDQAAENFCLNLNTPSNRKKLINTIGTIAKSRMDLIPFNCRLVCTLMPLMPHVGEDIIAIVLSTFRFFLRKRENINVSSKQKVVKYIAELTKFDLIDRSIALGCIRVLLADFRAHSIEMLCTLLTGCGKFLYLQEDSHRQLKLLLEKLDRLKIVKLPDYSSFRKRVNFEGITN